MSDVTYQFEYDKRLRCGFIGAGGHSYRNVYPSFQYAPIDLVAVCDIDADRAETYARTFGAERHYSDHRDMLAREDLDAVFVVTGYDDVTGRPQGTDLALDCLAAGVHVWMEKPAVASVQEAVDLRDAAHAADRFVLVGLKKIFTPAIEKVAEIIATDEFGPVSSISVRYPQDLPAPELRGDLNAIARVS